MTNLNKLYTFYNVHSHNEQEMLKELLETYLPKEYTTLVIEKLKENNIEVSASIIRNVKHGLTKNIAVFNAILQVAKSHKALNEQLKKNLQKAV